jgi:hypothetical protein
MNVRSIFPWKDGRMAELPTFCQLAAKRCLLQRGRRTVSLNWGGCSGESDRQRSESWRESGPSQRTSIRINALLRDRLAPAFSPWFAMISRTCLGASLLAERRMVGTTRVRCPPVRLRRPATSPSSRSSSPRSKAAAGANSGCPESIAHRYASFADERPRSSTTKTSCRRRPASSESKSATPRSSRACSASRRASASTSARRTPRPAKGRCSRRSSPTPSRRSPQPTARH